MRWSGRRVGIAPDVTWSTYFFASFPTLNKRVEPKSTIRCKNKDKKSSHYSTYPFHVNFHSRKDNARRVPKAMTASPSTSKSLTVGLCSGHFSEQNHQHGILRSAAPCTTLPSGGGPPTTRWCALGVFASAECQRGCSC
jgi:hypothetical protein